MRRRALLVAAAGLAGAGSALALTRGDPVPWPDGVTLLDGSAWAPRPGHAQVIVRWATWCPHCQRHNAHIETLHRQIGDARLQVLGVAADGDALAVRRYMQALDYHFPVTIDSAGFAGLSARRVVPLTITVDRDGRLREIIPGEMAEDDVMGLASLATTAR